MRFQVNYKGFSAYVGSLFNATSFLEQKWGSVAEAYAIGVKLVAVHDR